MQPVLCETNNLSLQMKLDCVLSHVYIEIDTMMIWQVEKTDFNTDQISSTIQR